MLNLNTPKGYDVFLGGTTNESIWRNIFIEEIKKVAPNIKCFNPVVDNWTPECIELENFIKATSKHHVYVITPLMIGVYSIAEAIESAMNNKLTYFVVLETDPTNPDRKFSEQMLYSLDAVGEMVKSHFGNYYRSNDLSSVIKDVCANFVEATIRSI